MPRPYGPLTGKIENFIRMEARGESANDIIREIFGVDPDTCSHQEKNRIWQTMYRWRHRPDAKAIWDDELSAVVRRHVPGAVRRLNSQVDNENDWVANKASNDVLALAKSLGVVRSEETAIKVQIEGIPELGSPDGE